MVICMEFTKGNKHNFNHLLIETPILPIFDKIQIRIRIHLIEIRTLISKAKYTNF